MQSIEVVAAVFEREGRFMIARKAPGKQLAGLWEFPGGKIEAGETGPLALARELKEEFGIDCQVKKLICRYPFRYPDKQIHIAFYRVETNAAIIPQNDHDAVAWLSREALGNMALAPADRDVLALL